MEIANLKTKFFVCPFNFITPQEQQKEKETEEVIEAKSYDETNICSTLIRDKSYGRIVHRRLSVLASQDRKTLRLSEMISCANAILKISRQYNTTSMELVTNIFLIAQLIT